MSETLKVRRTIAAGALLFGGGAALSGCHENYDGTGNEYTVHGRVHTVEKDDTIYISPKDLTVDSSSGKAVKWFTDHGSDDFKFDPDYNKRHFFCENNHRVGVVYDQDGSTIDPSELEPGQEVEIEGSIRSSDAKQGKYCASNNKNVFDVVQVQ